MNSVKETVISAVLPALREVCPEAERNDLLFFGSRADICSPLPLKYGLDSLDGIVYNLENRVILFGRPVFSSVSVSGGFINMQVGEEALSAIVSEVSEGELPPPAEVIRIGAYPESLYAALLDIANEGAGSKGLPEPGGAARLALWHLLNADSPSSLSAALKETEAAIRAHRRAAVHAEGSERISGEAAKAMAVSLSKHL
ncbi:MAG: hypothetical protein K6G56_02680 [Clostridiales bacterium]|nr:hypothetical protein [Clostridiales bacterium]